MTVKDRIKAFCKAEKIAISAFEKNIGVSNGYVNAISRSIGIDNLNTIIEKYSTLNIEWLLTGSGPMLKTTPTKPISPIHPIPHQEGNGATPIPLVSPTVAAGFGNENFAIAEADVKDYYTIPRFRHTHIDFMIEVTGDSMTPHLNSGDIIACAIVRDSQFIQWNKCHVIATVEQGLLVKRLMPGTDSDHLRAVSDNTRYPPFDIPKSEITGLALVIGSVCLE